jgi:F-type H+-transporting ATPase subunit b
MLDINLSTILLQMANFFILVFILYRFLFKPLQKTLIKREQETLRKMTEAELAQEQAEKKQQEFEEKTNNIKAEIAARKNEARIVIERTRQQMLHEVEDEVERLKQQTEENLARLRTEAVKEHQDQIGHMAADYIEKGFEALMTPELRQRYLTSFLDQLRDEELSKYFTDVRTDETSYVRLVLGEEPEKSFLVSLRNLLDEKLTVNYDLSYEVDPGIIAGGILRFENELIDGSLKGQIAQLQERYQEAA